MIVHGHNGREYRLPEFPTIVWKVSARRQGPCTNFSTVTTTVIRANPTVTSLQLEGIT